MGSAGIQVPRIAVVACLAAVLVGSTVAGAQARESQFDLQVETYAPSADAAEPGRWDMLMTDAPLMPVHAALLRTGKVWLAQGSGNNESRFDAGNFETVVWDPADESFTDVDTPWDVFCAGHSFLADGRLLVAGGTSAFAHGATDFKGTDLAFAFDPLLEQYEPLPPMHDARWYPTLVTLGNGRVFTIAGLDENATDSVVAEVFRPGQSAWKRRPDTPPWPMYPAMVLAKGGRLFYSGGFINGAGAIRTGFVDVDTTTVDPVAGLRTWWLRDHSGTVLLPPAQDQRVMIIGGGSSVGKPATRNVDVINLKAATPEWSPAPSLTHARMHVSSVLLPDRTVLVAGGGGSREAEPVHETEIYDPIANSWTAAAAMHEDRLYHSMALLLPDGRVLMAGSNPNGHEEHSIEIYSPPYLFAGPRPEILATPTEIRYGRSFRITTSQTAQIKWVNLMRPSAVTHSTDTEQRLVNVRLKRIDQGSLELSVTGDPTIAPPGWYMLTVTNQDGVPSVAKWVHLT